MIADYVPARRLHLKCAHCVHYFTDGETHTPQGGIHGIVCLGCGECGGRA